VNFNPGDEVGKPAAEDVDFIAIPQRKARGKMLVAGSGTRDDRNGHRQDGDASDEDDPGKEHVLDIC
jgi:hypothetical protein